MSAPIPDISDAERLRELVAERQNLETRLRAISEEVFEIWERARLVEPTDRTADEMNAQIPVTDLDWLMTEVIALYDDTERTYREAALSDFEGKTGAFARGRLSEAKSIRNALCEVIRVRKAESQSNPEPVSHDGPNR